ncbi:snoRNA-binding rRNA-processing protein DIP2 [Rhodotorula paludigena]|uniref:snoRNA-binding rRNA-processing protein DIP2 n=1 Tax=Rhodotorula paludigena TaxID=86838 RepID=UPI003172CD63
MVKSYLRHGPTEAFGVISSGPAVWDGRKAYCPALEDVLVWDVKKGEQVAMWHETGLRALVTSIARSPADWDSFAVGYADGSVRIWNAKTQSVTVTFNGHKTAVSALAWDADGTRLATGAKDTDVIVWDVVGEVGLFRLRGHRDQVTALAFVAARLDPDAEDAPLAAAADASTSSAAAPAPKPSTHLLSSSKDTFLKLWSLETQHCIETVVGHRSEAWSFAYDASSNVLVSGGGEGEVKCWRIDNDVLVRGVSALDDPSAAADAAAKQKKLRRAITPLAALSLPNPNHTHNISQITLHPTLPVLAIHSGERAVDVFRLRTEDELRKKLARRRKREREKKEKAAQGKGAKGKGKGKAVDGEEDAEDDEEPLGAGADGEVQWRDRLALWSTVRTSGKIRNFSFAPETAKNKGEVQILAALSNNSLEVFNLPPPASSKAPAVEPLKMFTLDLPGHRSDVRCLAVSSDDQLIASASHGSLKLWNVKTTRCVRTLDCGYAICCSFLPGDRHIVVGCKSGELLLYDLSSSALLETFPAHTAPLWSLHVRPDGRGLVTGSADKDVKFWDFEVREVPSEVEGGSSTRVLTLAHVKTLKMTDDVLAVKYSPDGRLLAVSLLDSTVKVFYADTLKFFLSLYGHKLPVLSLDISSDSKLIVTCSADKNVKIWGLDFGDCHRSLFAHDESVMQVAFERGSHLFWSVGKDRMVKYWDGDKFECIQKLQGHSGEVWALAVSQKANFVVTGSHDKSIRIWEKTDEPLFLEEERERELEEMYNNTANPRGERDELRVLPSGEEVPQAESTEVSKSTTETLMAGERILEALELAEADKAALAAYHDEVRRAPTDEMAKRVPHPTRNAVFSMYNNCSADEYVLKIVRGVPAAQQQDALLVLPFGRVMQLIEHIDVWAHRGWNLSLTSRVLFFLLRTHHSQIVATRALRPTMVALKGHLRDALKKQKNTLGYNLAALKYLARQHEANRVAEFYEQDVLGTGENASLGMADEQEVRKMIEASAKKRKRATLRS